MIYAYRLTKSPNQFYAFSGEGAKRYPGRWNTLGVPVVYLAEHLAVATLEILVHWHEVSQVSGYVYYQVQIEPLAIETANMTKVSKDWASAIATTSTKEYGATWAQQLRSPVLCIPSAVVPEAKNYILNPLHPELLQAIEIKAPQPYRLDERLEQLLSNAMP